MAKLTWLGENDLHRTVTDEGLTVEAAGPSFTTWGKYKFPIGEAVEVSEPDIIRRAKGNKFFKVEEQKQPEPTLVEPKPAEPDPDLPNQVDHTEPVEHHEAKHVRKPRAHK